MTLERDLVDNKITCHIYRRRQDEPYGILGTARHSGETGIPACETAGGERRQPESQPESRPESLRARVIRQLADGLNVEGRHVLESGAEGYFRSTQQGDPVARCRRKHRIHYSRKTPKPAPKVPPDGQGTVALEQQNQTTWCS